MKTEPLTPAAIWLREARNKLRLTRHALALAAGVAPGTLRSAEECRHRLTRDCAKRLMAEIGRRDALLVRTAPSPLREAAGYRAQWTNPASEPGTPALPAAPPVAFLRFHARGARALLQLELDPGVVRKLVRAIGDQLARSERLPLSEQPPLHLIVMETK